MTLRRFLAALSIATIAGSFSLRLACETSCENGSAGTPLPHCHKAIDTGATVGQAPDCGQHDADPVMTEARRNTNGATPLIALPVSSFRIEALRSSSSMAVATFIDTSPPRTSRPLALRI